MKNAAYLDPEWMDGTIKLTNHEVAERVRTMKTYGIHDQFADCGTVDDNGVWNRSKIKRLGHWVAYSHQEDPGQRVMGYISYGKRRIGPASNPLFGTAKFMQNLDGAVKEIMGTGVDGFHLDIELFLDNDTRLLDVIRYLRMNSLRGKFFSMAVPSGVWTANYIKQVAAELDQINPMIYDAEGWGSEVVDEATYQTYFDGKLQVYVDAIGNSIPCEIVPTFPAYELKQADNGDGSFTVYHDPTHETMKAAIAATKAVMAKPGYPGNIKGAAIFWWPHFAGYTGAAYPYAARDQAEWNTNWKVL